MGGAQGHAHAGSASGRLAATAAGRPWGSTLAGLMGLLVLALQMVGAVAPGSEIIVEERERPATAGEARDRRAAQREILLAGYVGAPLYLRSDVHMSRPDGTELHLEQLGWDGDPLYFPVDGGVRSVEWWGPLGLSVDFLHNKAIARLGRGAHGRRLSYPVVETVATRGTLAQAPIAGRTRLTDVFERLEFTHGHNMLFLTPMLRLGTPYPGLRPYFGIGGGPALPHVEVWFPGGAREDRTSEYQLAGAAVQIMAGLELRRGRASYFLELKLSHAWITASLTGDESWKNFNMPGDLWRQFRRWWRGQDPMHGRITTTLTALQPNLGAGYWTRWTRAGRTQPRP